MQEHRELFDVMAEMGMQQRVATREIVKSRAAVAASVRLAIPKYLSELAELAETTGAREWTIEDQKNYNILLNSLEKGYRPETAIGIEDDATREIRDTLEGDEFADVRDKVADKIAQQNAKAKAEVATAKIEAKDEIMQTAETPHAPVVEDYGLTAETPVAEERVRAGETPIEGTTYKVAEAEAGEFARENVVITGSQRVKSKAVGLRTVKVLPMSEMFSIQEISTLYPLTFQSYSEVFGERDTKSNFEEGIIHIGNLTFNLNVSKDTIVMDRLTQLYGPHWAIAVEMGHDATAEIEDTVRLLAGIKKKLRPGELRRVAAFVTVATQGDSMVPVEIIGTQMPTQQVLLVTAQSIVDYFNMKGLPLDPLSSPVSFADLGGEYGGVQAAEALEQEQETRAEEGSALESFDKPRIERHA